MPSLQRFPGPRGDEDKVPAGTARHRFPARNRVEEVRYDDRKHAPHSRGRAGRPAVSGFLAGAGPSVAGQGPPPSQAADRERLGELLRLAIRRYAVNVNQAVAARNGTGQAGVRDARLHDDVRHTAASLLLLLTVPARAIMDVLGHSSYQLQPRLAELNSAAARLWPGRCGGTRRTATSPRGAARGTDADDAGVRLARAAVRRRAPLSRLPLGCQSSRRCESNHAS